MIKQTVYLVDDDPCVLTTLPRALRRRGFTVEAFDTAKEFLNAFVPDKPSCLILDLSMPDMSGLELQETLIKRGCQIPIIFITGHGGVPESVQAIRAGAIDFLEKPFAQDVLLARIKEAFDQDASARRKREKMQEIQDRFKRLTSREKEILHLLISQPNVSSSKSIAKELGISHRTVEQHRANILEKTNTTSLDDLLHLADLAKVSVSEMGSA